jgi:hypothetical protein
LDALIAESEMQFSLSKKRTAKEAWDAIAAARIGSDRARKTTLQALHKERENLAFKPGEDVDDFALHRNTLQQKMVQFSDGDEPQPLSEPITVGGKLHLTREQWEACQGDEKKGESNPSMGGRKHRRCPRWRRQHPEAGTRRRLPQLWQAWPLGQEVSTATTRPGPRRIGGGGASSTPGIRKHRVISSGISRSDSPPP